MGESKYSISERHARATLSSYFVADTSNPATVDAVFTQNVKRMIHESMDPKQALLREARDSKVHPNTVPIIFGLDVTGSMGRIPVELIKDGLPHLMGTIIEHGTPDPALLFLAVGDTTCDHYPLQVGQFESGDAELDTWLTRTYLEGGGGGNEGESYLLAWYFAAKHTVTDAWEKRHQKGFLFTVGDEPCLNTLPKNVIGSLMGTTPQDGFTADGLLAQAQERYNVYHLHIMEGSAGKYSYDHWKQRLGDHCIRVDHFQDVAKITASIVVDGLKHVSPPVGPKTDSPKEEEML